MRHGVSRGSRIVVGYQRWHDLLFVHAPVAAEPLRALVDPRLELDLLAGVAWVSLTPFTVRAARLRGLPPLPLLGTFHELNLRTYVRRDGEPGVWFFSLDAASALAAAIARTTLGLPYRAARMSRAAAAGIHDYRSERVSPGPRPASFSARWLVGGELPGRPGSPEHFLAERYALYTTLRGRLLRVRVRHPPWRLRAARLEHLEETVTRAAGLPPPSGDRLVRFSHGVDAAFFPPERVG
jgi:uncharacterized protein YqjF (DUF2071 family)